MTLADLEKPRRQPQQTRSRARRAALVEHGALLLNSKDLDEVSVSEITDVLGYSTGSFYSYFDDKAAFFVSVQEWVNQQNEDEIVAKLESDQILAMGLNDRLEACVDFALGFFREHTGVVRSALRYERRIPQAWAPHRATTKRIIEGACRGLSPDQRHRLEIAIQLAFGMLVNALLHNPGPLRLNDPNMGPEIMKALEPYLSGP